MSRYQQHLTAACNLQLVTVIYALVRARFVGHSSVSTHLIDAARSCARGAAKKQLAGAQSGAEYKQQGLFQLLPGGCDA